MDKGHNFDEMMCISQCGVIHVEIDQSNVTNELRLV